MSLSHNLVSSFQLRNVTKYFKQIRSSTIFSFHVSPSAEQSRVWRHGWQRQDPVRGIQARHVCPSRGMSASPPSFNLTVDSCKSFEIEIVWIALICQIVNKVKLNISSGLTFSLLSCIHSDITFWKNKLYKVNLSTCGMTSILFWEVSSSVVLCTIPHPQLADVPCEFVTHFDPACPMVLGGLLSSENSIGFVQVRVKFWLYQISIF